MSRPSHDLETLWRHADPDERVRFLRRAALEVVSTLATNPCDLDAMTAFGLLADAVAIAVAKEHFYGAAAKLRRVDHPHGTRWYLADRELHNGDAVEVVARRRRRRCGASGRSWRRWASSFTHRRRGWSGWV